MKILVAFDGSLNAKTALRYGIEKVRKTGGEVIALQVFQSEMFIDYGAGPTAEGVARNEAARYLDEARAILEKEGAGIPSRVLEVEGNPEQEISRFAEENNVGLIIAPPRYRSLAKKAGCPVSIVPGNVLVPVDSTDSYGPALERAAEEAALTGSRVVLVGIVPVNLYSRWEKAELDMIRKQTGEALKKAKKILSLRGIETKETVRSGYPDEEILRVADEYPVTMIFIAETGERPSELVKAAGIIDDEEQQFRRPLCLVPFAKSER